MAVIALQIGNIDISLTEGFEKQGFAVMEVSGLSEYGEHNMGVPGSNDVVISGVVLPGTSPSYIRNYIYTSINPYEPFVLQATHDDGNALQATAYVKTVGWDVNASPTTVSITIVRQSGWFGDPCRKILSGSGVSVSEPQTLVGVFEFVAPLSIDIQLKKQFSNIDLLASKLDVYVGVEPKRSRVQVDFSRLRNMFPNGLLKGSVIQITTDLNYQAHLFSGERIHSLPVLGVVEIGMVPTSTNPPITISTNMPEHCELQVIVQSRQTFLTT